MIERSLQQLVGHALHEIPNRLQDLKGAFVRSVALTADLARAAKDILPTSATFFDSVRKAQTVRLEREQNIDRIMYSASKLSRDSQRRVNAFLAESRLAEKWGYEPEHLKGGQDVEDTCDGQTL